MALVLSQPGKISGVVKEWTGVSIDDVLNVQGFPFVGVIIKTVTGANVDIEVSNDKTNWVTYTTVTTGDVSKFVTTANLNAHYIRVHGAGASVAHISVVAQKGGI